MTEPKGDLAAKLFNKVRTHMGWNYKRTMVWFTTKNPHFGWLTPKDFIERRPEKAEKTVNTLIWLSSEDGP